MIDYDSWIELNFFRNIEKMKSKMLEYKTFKITELFNIHNNIDEIENLNQRCIIIHHDGCCEPIEPIEPPNDTLHILTLKNKYLYLSEWICLFYVSFNIQHYMYLTKCQIFDVFLDLYPVENDNINTKSLTLMALMGSTDVDETTDEATDETTDE